MKATLVSKNIRKYIKLTITLVSKLRLHSYLIHTSFITYQKTFIPNRSILGDIKFNINLHTITCISKIKIITNNQPSFFIKNIKPQNYLNLFIQFQSLLCYLIPSIIPCFQDISLRDFFSNRSIIN